MELTDPSGSPAFRCKPTQWPGLVPQHCLSLHSQACHEVPTAASTSVIEGTRLQFEAGLLGTLSKSKFCGVSAEILVAGMKNYSRSVNRGKSAWNWEILGKRNSVSHFSAETRLVLGHQDLSYSVKRLHWYSAAFKPWDFIVLPEFQAHLTVWGTITYLLWLKKWRLREVRWMVQTTWLGLKASLLWFRRLNPLCYPQSHRFSFSLL